MRVLKFGGTSIANVERFINVANIIANRSYHEQIAVVLSAPDKITNYFVSMIQGALNGVNIQSNIHDAKKIFILLLDGLIILQPNFNYKKIRNLVDKEFEQVKKILYGISLLRCCPDRINAEIICRGEKLSIVFMKELLVARGFEVTIINPVEKLLAKGSYLESIIDIDKTIIRFNKNKIINYQHVILMAGFIAGNEYGELVVLGRNGSDYSATILAACLHADYCEIWTDVDGVYTCDPHQVFNARLLNTLSYLEAMELSYFGAKILHPRSIIPIAKFQIPCVIKNTNNLQSFGTLISSTDKNYINNPIKGIAHLSDIAMINVSGSGMKGTISMSARIFTAMAHVGSTAILITQSSSECNISFCILHKELSIVCKAIEEEFYLEIKNGLLNPLEIISQLTIISVIGDGIHTQHYLQVKLFKALTRAKTNIIAIAQGSSKRSISVVIDNNVTASISFANQMLFNNTDRIIEIFIIGTEEIGIALMEKIYQQSNWLKDKRINLKVFGIANLHSLSINIYGINLKDWRSTISKKNKPFKLDKLIDLIKGYNLLNPVIVDCTNSSIIVSQYLNFLINGFHIVTANKESSIISMDFYYEIRATAKSFHRKFLYSANICAGLPVVESLKDLLNTGNKIISFSGILSGSLSFIFGKLEEGVNLSTAILIASNKGYTQPDLRDDLSGMDVARKMVIIAREAGFSLELKDINVESILPCNFDINGDIKDFCDRLSVLNNEFTDKVNNTFIKKKKLRYIGSIDKDRCSVKIETVGISSPLFTVKNGENALVFLTSFYQSSPLILRGYNAGNDIIATSIFTDILRILPW